MALTDEMTKEDELDLINLYTRNPLTQDNVYTFNVTLCDNEIDRDFERFTKEALQELGKLFLGKTGISDHSMRSEDQSARIFYTWVETDSTKKTSFGENYCCLKAKAYMVRTNSNCDLISEIDAGIKKEVSVGCSMRKIQCSICGADAKLHSCEHIKGKSYGGKICCSVLSDASDAYEWSFVAVPAQRQAGVTKSLEIKGDDYLEKGIDVIKSASQDILLTKAQANELKEYISQLEILAEDGCAFRETLTDEIGKLALIVMPKVNAKEFIIGCKGMTISQLKSFRDGLEKQAKDIIPPTPQLKSISYQTISDNTPFKI